MQKQTGFTLIEILVSLGLLALLAGVAITAINPARQFALARNTQRKTDLASLFSAITQNMVEHQGKWDCATALPEQEKPIKTGELDIRTCLVPKYLAELPTDPSVGLLFASDKYDTGYTLVKSADTGRLKLRAPSAELGETIELTK